MFGYKNIDLMFDERALTTARTLVANGRVAEFDIDEDNFPEITLYGVIHQGFYKYPCDVTIDVKEEKVLSFSCTCKAKTYRNDMHIATLLLYFLQLQDIGKIQKYTENYLPTSKLIKTFLENNVTRTNDIPYVGGDLILSCYKGKHKTDDVEDDQTYYNIDSEDISDHSLCVEFRVSKPGTKDFIVKNITELCHAVLENKPMKFGKQIDVILDMRSFNIASQKILEFLISLLNEKDAYKEKIHSDFYQRIEETNEIRKQIYLRGRYLDEFIEVLGDKPIYMSDDAGNYGPARVIDHPILPTGEISKVDGGYRFFLKEKKYFLGRKYIYSPNDHLSEIYRAPYENAFIEINDLARQMDGLEQYISEEDTKQFTKQLWPLLETNSDLTITDYHPQEYLPPKPKFEIYLDMPQSDMIVCEVYSCYQDQKYNVLERNRQNELLRDIEEENKVDRIVTGYFNNFDQVRHRAVLVKDEDKLFNLLNQGVPYFATFAKVFASEKVKKVSVRPVGKVSFGVSVNHDLLQLNLSGDKRTLEDLSEILSKYDAKKKYYRLKNGSFVTVDDASVSQFFQMNEELQISTKDVKKGSVELPVYRALYLDRLVSDDDEFETDEHFNQLVSNIKEVEEKQFEIPENLKDTLRDYQVNGYRWLRALQINGFGALLADEMGLGKSVQVISLIQSMENHGRVIIVCPASLVYNWSAEFKKFSPQTNVLMISGGAEYRKELIENSSDDAVLITSYDALKRDVEIYQKMRFDIEVIDEAQYIKNASTMAASSVKEINAKFKVALTGTPIENRLSELWSIFDFIMPGFLHSYARFKKVFEGPIMKDQDEEVKERLRKLISPFVLRRLKKNVLKDLPDKLEEVMYASLEGEQKELYEARKQRLKIMLTNQTAKQFNENKIEVLSELTRLRQICCQPGLIYEGYQGNSAKEEMCINLIQQAIDEGHKILLFSQFTSMLDHLIGQLNQNGIQYHLLTGSTKKEDRAKMVDAFQTDDVPLFLISLKAGGTGLNLTAADIVIHYDPWWNTAVENQATDRAHRIGQENIVTVYRLIVKDTIEERIVELQSGKADLAEEIFSGEEMASSKLTREQLLEIL